MHSARSRNNNSHRFYLWLGLVVALIAIAFTISWLHAHPGALLGVTPTAGALMASMYVPVMPKTAAELDAATRATKTMVVRGPLYDQQAYTSGATTQLNFFNAINGDKTLSNARGNGGTLPQGTFFQPIWINVDIVAQPTIGTGAITGMLDDINKLIFVGRGTLSLTIGQTTLPQIPISYCHSSGGPVGTMAASFTAPSNAQFGYNGTQDSGYCIDGSFIITPNTQFAAQINWAAAQTLFSTVPFIKVSLDGNWYLPIVG